jgi:peptidoglycan/xylan/chitin deacetylase (PgdA/CDA1 family)
MLQPTPPAADSASLDGDSVRRARLPSRRAALAGIAVLILGSLLAGQSLIPAGAEREAVVSGVGDPTPAVPGVGGFGARHQADGSPRAGTQPDGNVAGPEWEALTIPSPGSPTAPTSSESGEPAASADPTPSPNERPAPTASAVAVTPKPVFSLRVPVLTYHVLAPWEIGQAYASTDSDVVPELFEAQLKALRDGGWRTVTANALADALRRERPLPRRTMVIAIDDGHDDGFDFGLPILRRHGFAATYYVISGRVGQPTYLTWDQVRALRDAGMEIGNHTVDHVPLTTLAAPDVLRQIARAQTDFTERLGRAPTTFAYPFGKFDSVTISAVRTAGLRLAFTTMRGQTATWATRFTLPRVHVGGTMTPAQLLKVVNQFLVPTS